MCDGWIGQVMADYRAALLRREYASGTINSRVSKVRCWLRHAGRGWMGATWHDIDAYGDHRRQSVSASAWRDEISHLSHFYRWAMRNDLAERDPTVLVERPRVRRRLPRPATDLQYRRLCADAPAMLLAILEMMAYCGLRCCEVSALAWADVSIEKHRAIVRGKGGRERVIELPVDVARALAAIDADTMHVFTGLGGRGLSPARVSQIVSQWAQARGVPITAHQLRHFYATMVLEECGDIYVTKAALGHLSVASTEIYAELDPRHVLDVQRRVSARHRPELRLFDDFAK